MKTRLKVFLMCFVLLCMSLFTGCSLVETNNGKLYNGVVAEIYNEKGNKVAEVTNREFIAGYESYGNVYAQYYGYSVSQAVDMTLKQLENRKIVILTAEKLFGINYKTGEGLSKLEKAYLYESTVNSLYSNLDTYYNEIVKGGSSSEESNSDAITFKGYTKNVNLGYDENGNLTIKKVDKQNGILDNYRPENEDKNFYNSEDKAQIYDNLLDKAFSNEDYERSLKLYLVDLKTAENGLKLSTDTKSIFEREIERLYKINYENYVIQKYSENNKSNDEIASVSVQDIINLYSSKVRAGYTKYVIEKSSKYDSDVSESLNNVYYFKNDDASTKFFTVANILFQFNDAQKAKYEEINNKLSSSEPYDSYESDMNALYSQIVPVIRQLNEDTGEYEEIENNLNLSVNDIIYDKIQILLNSAKSTGDVGVIGDTINNLIYTYNQDPGMFNAETNYVIGVDNEGNAVSSFVEEFNEAGLKLYNDGKGQVGDMEIARSSYGIHVLVYTGKCENLFDGIDEDFELSEDAIAVLATTRVNKLVDKTYLDLLYDEIFKDEFSYFEQANMNFLREDYNFKTYKGRLPKSLRG